MISAATSACPELKPSSRRTSHKLTERRHHAPLSAVKNNMASTSAPPKKLEKGAAATARMETLASAPVSPHPSSGGFWDIVASSQIFLSQILGHFTRQLQMDQAEMMLQEASVIEREKQLNATPVNIKPYLSPVGVWEAKHCRRLCHLAGLAYKPINVNDGYLRRTQKMELVSSSWTYQAPFSVISSLDDALNNADGMAVSFEDVNSVYSSAKNNRTAASGSLNVETKNDVRTSWELLEETARSAGAGTPYQWNEASPSRPEASPPSGRDAGSDAGQVLRPSPDALTSQSIAASMSQQAPAGSTAKRWSGSPADSVASKLSEAYEAASCAAAAAASPLASAAGSLYAGLGFLPGLGGGSVSSSSVQYGRLEGSEAASGSAPGRDRPAATVAAPPSSPPPGAVSWLAPSVSVSQSASSVCPSEWFVCDDPVAHLRIFVIQGSDSLDHWKLNLTFDPVTFEDPELGVTVHRGVYEAAQVLYYRFLPMVQDHLASSPFARVTFTGHSIGGSLGTLLMFMYAARGVLPLRSISTVYTFGAPSVFCESPEESFQASSSAFSEWPGSSASAAQRRRTHVGGPSRLMASLGLREYAVRNVIMGRDVVPRAFSCDYSIVADILKSWGPGFRGHLSLGYDGRKHLYYFVGRMIILQPDRTYHSFVGGDPDHPLLPPGPGLFYLAEPAEMNLPPLAAMGSASSSGTATTGGGQKGTAALGPSGGGSSRQSRSSWSRAAQPRAAGPSETPTAVSTSPPVPTWLRDQVSSSSPSPVYGRVPPSAHEAVMELMDFPHPLESLADPAAYLEKGIISRYHNPDNYSTAFGRVIHLRRRLEGSSAVRQSSPLSILVREALSQRRSGAVRTLRRSAAEQARHQRDASSGKAAGQRGSSSSSSGTSSPPSSPSGSGALPSGSWGGSVAYSPPGGLPQPLGMWDSSDEADSAAPGTVLREDPSHYQ